MLLDREISATFRKRAVSETFTLARAEETPFSTMLKAGPKPKSTLYEWPFKTRHAPSNSAVSDGVDADTAAAIDNSANKAMLQGRTQKGRVIYGVGAIAELAGYEYGAGNSLLADNATDAIVLAKENLEVTLLGNVDSRAETNASTPNLTRGLANWIRTANPGGSPDLPVPTAALCPAGNVVTGVAAGSDVTEDQFRGIMQSIATAKRANRMQHVFMTPLVKATVSNWARSFTQVATTSGGTTTTNVPLRSFNFGGKDKTIGLSIMFYEGDFGRLAFHTHYSLPANHHAIFADMDAVERRTLEAPTVQKLEYRGGGHYRFIDYIVGLAVTDPTCHGKITT